jgi:hypothetical protein
MTAGQPGQPVSSRTPAWLADTWPSASTPTAPAPTTTAPGGTWHRTDWQAQPFVTFAGPWAEAMWTVEHDPDVDELDEALDYAWADNSDGDFAKYESRVELLNHTQRRRTSPHWSPTTNSVVKTTTDT